jgi:hypothetical protein
VGKGEGIFDRCATISTKNIEAAMINVERLSEHLVKITLTGKIRAGDFAQVETQVAPLMKGDGLSAS